MDNDMEYKDGLSDAEKMELMQAQITVLQAQVEALNKAVFGPSAGEELAGRIFDNITDLAGETSQQVQESINRFMSTRGNNTDGNR